MRKKYYVVEKGRTKGLFDSWHECESQVSGYKGARYKSFSNLAEAIDYAIIEVDDGISYVIDVNRKREWYKTYHEFSEALLRL